MQSPQIRKPTFAGHLYPEKKEELKEIIQTYIQSARIDGLEQHVVLKGLIVPADGYHFAGNTIAYPYKYAQASKGIKRIYILAPLNVDGLIGCILSTALEYKCPTGSLKVSHEGIFYLKKL